MDPLLNERREMARTLNAPEAKPDRSMAITRRTFLHKSLRDGRDHGRRHDLRMAAPDQHDRPRLRADGLQVRLALRHASVSEEREHALRRKGGARVQGSAGHGPARRLHDLRRRPRAARRSGRARSRRRPAEGSEDQEGTSSPASTTGTSTWARSGRSLFGQSPWKFDHKGVRFIGLDTVGRARLLDRQEDDAEGADGPHVGARRHGGAVGRHRARSRCSGCRATLGNWRRTGRSSSSRHTPLYEYYPPWNFWMRDWREAHEVAQAVQERDQHPRPRAPAAVQRDRQHALIGMLATSWPWPYAPTGVPELTKCHDPRRIRAIRSMGSVGASSTIERGQQDRPANTRCGASRMTSSATAEVDSGTGDNRNQILQPAHCRPRLERTEGSTSDENQEDDTKTIALRARDGRRLCRRRVLVATGRSGPGLRAQGAARRGQLKAFQDAFMEQVMMGDRLFHGDDAAEKQMEVQLSKTGMACAMCHPIGSDTHPHEFPKFQEQMSEFATLRDMINWCIEKPNEGVKIDPNGSAAMKALEAYIYWSNHGSEAGRRAALAGSRSAVTANGEGGCGRMRRSAPPSRLMLSRRRLFVVAGGAVGLALVRGRLHDGPAQAAGSHAPSPHAAPPIIRLPVLTENGAKVPVVVEVDHPMDDRSPRHHDHGGQRAGPHRGQGRVLVLARQRPGLRGVPGAARRRAVHRAGHRGVQPDRALDRRRAHPRGGRRGRLRRARCRSPSAPRPRSIPR